MSDVARHYDQSYFTWQRSIGDFGGWANSPTFAPHIRPGDTVIDFGCGGGFLLKALNCSRRIGIEINPSAREAASANGVETYATSAEVSDGIADVVISNHALEHVLDPAAELRSLRKKLKPGGRLVLVVPSETIFADFIRCDINRHLFTWSPSCLGNLLEVCGWNVVNCNGRIFRWPPKAEIVARIFGRSGFNLVCRIYGALRWSWFHVVAVAEPKPDKE